MISLIHPENKPSMKVAERLGEKLEGTTRLDQWDVLIYGIDRLMRDRGGANFERDSRRKIFVFFVCICELLIF